MIYVSDFDKKKYNRFFYLFACLNNNLKLQFEWYVSNIDFFIYLLTFEPKYFQIDKKIFNNPSNSNIRSFLEERYSPKWVIYGWIHPIVYHNNFEKEKAIFWMNKDAILNWTKHSFIQECENERGSGNAIKITYSFDARSSFKKNSQMINKMRNKIFPTSI